jgi:hypothetical protein
VNRFAGQVSFGLALIDLDLPVGWMPVGTNYGSFGDGFPSGEVEATFTGTMSPLGLHYHTRLTLAGRLKETGVPAVAATVAKVNAALDEPASREVLEVALHNWQESLDPPLSRRSKLTRRWLTPSR